MSLPDHSRFLCFIFFVAGVLLNILPSAHADELYPKEIDDNFDQTHNFECIGSYGENIRNFVVQGHYAYLGQGYTMRVLDIADPANPREVGWLRVAGEISTMDVNGPALYLATDHEGRGLKIIDISDPTHPRLRDTGRGDNLHLMARLMGDYLLVDQAGKYGMGYEIDNVKDPFNPVKVTGGGRMGNRDNRFPFCTDGHRLIQASCEDLVWPTAIRDLTTSPTTLGYLNFPFSEFLSVDFKLHQGRILAGDDRTTITIPLAEPPRSIWRLSPYLNVRTFSSKWMLEEAVDYYNETFRLIRSSEPEKSLLEIKSNDWDSRGVVMTGKALYAIIEDKVKVYDLAGAQPVERGFFSGITAPKCPIQVIGNMAIVNSDEGLKFFDVSDPLAPLSCGEYRTHKGVDQAEIAGDRAYLIDGEKGLVILDVTEPARPRLLARNQLAADTTIMAVENRLVFLSDGDAGFHILDCSVPTSPSLRGTWSHGLGPMCVSGSRIYMAQGGLKILDISNPASIRLLGQFGKGSPIQDIATSGTLVYLRTKEAITVIDASNPLKPVMRGRIDDETDSDGDYKRLWFKRLDSALYDIFATQSGGNADSLFDVVNISNPSSPAFSEKKQGSDPDTPGGPEPKPPAPAFFPPNPAAKFPGWYLSLPSAHPTTGRDRSGLEIYDCSDPLHPRFAGRYDRTQTYERVAFYKDTIFLADRWGGLLIIRHIPGDSSKNHESTKSPGSTQ